MNASYVSWELSHLLNLIKSIEEMCLKSLFLISDVFFKWIYHKRVHNDIDFIHVFVRFSPISQLIRSLTAACKPSCTSLGKRRRRM